MLCIKCVKLSICDQKQNKKCEIYIDNVHVVASMSKIIRIRAQCLMNMITCMNYLINFLDAASMTDFFVV